jgi:hypothetical protein
MVWLPGQISKQSWTLAILGNFIAFASLFISMSLTVLSGSNTASVKNISVRAEWLNQCGRHRPKPAEAPRWRITPCLASIMCVRLHIPFQSLFHRFFLLCWSPIVNERSSVVANFNHTSDWLHWVRACIRIATRWVTLPKSLLAFLLPSRNMQFSLYSLYRIER